MNQGTKDQQSSLTAREIFNRILAGEVVKIPNDPQLVEQLRNHLNVIKSRDKKLFKSLGLDFTASVIKIEFKELPTAFIYDPKIINPEELNKTVGCMQFLPREAQPITIIPSGFYEIKLVAPKIRKRYPVFTIEEDGEPNPI